MSNLKQFLEQKAAAKAVEKAFLPDPAPFPAPALSWKDKLQASVATPVVSPVASQVQSPEEVGQDALSSFIEALASSTTVLSAPLGPTVVEYPIGFGRVRVTIELIVGSE